MVFLNFLYLFYKKIGFNDEVIFFIIKFFFFVLFENFLKDRFNCLIGFAVRGDVLIF